MTRSTSRGATCWRSGPSSIGCECWRNQRRVFFLGVSNATQPKGGGHCTAHQASRTTHRSWLPWFPPVPTPTRGDPIPPVDYTPQEVATWAAVLAQLQQLLPQHACREYLRALPQFGFAPDRVSQSQPSRGCGTAWRIGRRGVRRVRAPSTHSDPRDIPRAASCQPVASCRRQHPLSMRMRDGMRTSVALPCHGPTARPSFPAACPSPPLPLHRDNNLSL